MGGGREVNRVERGSREGRRTNGRRDSAFRALLGELEEESENELYAKGKRVSRETSETDEKDAPRYP